MATTASIQRCYNKYGSTDGWYVFAVGFCTMWFKTAKEAKGWASGKGLDLVK